MNCDWLCSSTSYDVLQNFNDVNSFGYIDTLYGNENWRKNI